MDYKADGAFSDDIADAGLIKKKIEIEKEMKFFLIRMA